MATAGADIIAASREGRIETAAYITKRIRACRSRGGLLASPLWGGYRPGAWTEGASLYLLLRVLCADFSPKTRYNFKHKLNNFTIYLLLS